MPDLHLKTKQQESLAGFAERMRTTLGLGPLEHRFSSNYIDEEYYTTATLGLRITIARSDEMGLEDYQFWIYFEPNVIRLDDATFIHGVADLVARALTLSGESVVRNAGPYIDSPRFFYELNGSGQEAIVVVTQR